MAVVKRGKYYHYRFNSLGKIYSGVCREESGEKATLKRAAEQAEQRERERTVKLEAQKSVKGIVENFKRELAGGASIKVDEALSKYWAKPRSKTVSPYQRELTTLRWQDFSYYLEDNFPDAKFIHQVTQAMAEDYVAFLDTCGPYADFHLAKTAKLLGTPLRTLKSYMKRSDWPGNGSIAKCREYIEANALRLAPKHRAKRRAFTPPRNIAISPQARNNYLGACKMIFKVLARDAGCIDNPFDHIPKRTNTPESRDAFTPAELKIIAENAKGWKYTLFLVGINTGFREGDICLLKWDEVDLQAGWITRKMNKTGRQVEVPIMAPLRKYLEALERSSVYCFPELASRYTNHRTTIGRQVREFLESLGITTTKMVKGRTRAVSIKDVHSCRHTFVYLAALHNIPLPVVQRIVGHVSLDMTEKYSNHARRAEIAASLATVPNYMACGDVLDLDTPTDCLDRILQKIKELPADKMAKLEEWLANL